MKKYSDAELQIVRMNNNDIVTTSKLGINTDGTYTNDWGNAADRFRDWEDF